MLKALACAATQVPIIIILRLMGQNQHDEERDEKEELKENVPLFTFDIIRPALMILNLCSGAFLQVLIKTDLRP